MGLEKQAKPVVVNVHTSNSAPGHATCPNRLVMPAAARKGHQRRGASSWLRACELNVASVDSTRSPPTSRAMGLQEEAHPVDICTHDYRYSTGTGKLTGTCTAELTCSGIHDRGFCTANQYRNQPQKKILHPRISRC